MPAKSPVAVGLGNDQAKVVPAQQPKIFEVGLAVHDIGLRQPPIVSTVPIGMKTHPPRARGGCADHRSVQPARARVRITPASIARPASVNATLPGSGTAVTRTSSISTAEAPIGPFTSTTPKATVCAPL